MKKTLIALAAVAAVGAASAQSTVTFFGLVDLGAGVTKDSSTSTAGVTTSAKRTGMESVINGSRFGFRGTEDLGGGLKAEFLGEFRMFADEISTGSFNGAQSSAGFGENRQSFVGLSSATAGAVRLGRQYTPYHALQGGFDMVNGNTNSLPGNVAAASSRQRASNAVIYTAPTIAGISASVMYGFGEAIAGQSPTTTATNSSNSSTSWAIRYDAGPLALGAGQDRVSNYQAAAVTTGASTNVFRYRGLIADTVAAGAFIPTSLAGQVGSTVTSSMVAASYDLGVAKVSGKVFSAKDSAASSQKFDGYYLGVNVPVTGQFSLSGSVSRADLTNSVAATAANGNDAKLSGYQLLAKYDLSKRTTLYAAVGQDKLAAASGSAELKRQQTAAGIRHSF